MRKNLASHAEVAHYWANDTQLEGKCGNMFFEKDLIYSYGHHFVIARRTDKEDEHGTQIVLVNAHTYSKTTAGHISLTRRAASHYRRIIVPYPATEGDNIQRSNMEYLNGEVLSLVDKLKRSKTGVAYAEGMIREAVADAVTYHAVFAPDCQTRPLPLPDDFGAVLGAARERERVFQLSPTDEILKKRAADREKRRVQAEKKALVERADAVAKWRAGESVYLRALPVMLRLHYKGEEVETSLDARVPIDHAKRLFVIIKRCRATGKTFHANGKSISIGVYKVTSIDAAGTLTVGCHVIGWEEIERFAKSQMWEV